MKQLAAQIPWFHNCAILDKVKASPERECYIRVTIQNGWGRNVLIHQIESDLYTRQRKPSPQTYSGRGYPVESGASAAGPQGSGRARRWAKRSCGAARLEADNDDRPYEQAWHRPSDCH